MSSTCSISWSANQKLSQYIIPQVTETDNRIYCELIDGSRGRSEYKLENWDITYGSEEIYSNTCFVNNMLPALTDMFIFLSVDSK